MRHCREDYEAIQPWPTKRPHHAKVQEESLDPEGGLVDRLYMNLSKDSLEQLGKDGAKPIIPDDEPVFLIRAQDVVGPAVVNEWARLAELNGADAALCERVRQFAHEMKAYADEHGKKTPDTPPALLKEVSA